MVKLLGVHTAKTGQQLGLIALAVAFVLLGLLLPLRPALVLYHGDTELAVLPLGQADHFDIAFRHSVNRGEIIERYSFAPGGQIYLAEAWFENYGAGMMDTLAEGVIMDETGEMLHLRFPAAPIPALYIGTAGLAGTGLIINQHHIDLYALNPYSTITIRTKKISLWTTWQHTTHKN